MIYVQRYNIFLRYAIRRLADTYGARNRYALRMAGHQSPRQIVRDGTAGVLVGIRVLLPVLLPLVLLLLLSVLLSLQILLPLLL